MLGMCILAKEKLPIDWSNRGTKHTLVYVKIHMIGMFINLMLDNLEEFISVDILSRF